MVNGEIHSALGGALPDSHTLIQLANKDGDCYVNSVLQALYNLGPVQAHIWGCQLLFEREALTVRAEQSHFGFFVRIFVDSMRAPQNEVWYEPNYFLDSLFHDGRFQRGTPSDAHEFFLFLVNSLSDIQNLINFEQCRDLFDSFADTFRFAVERTCAYPEGDAFVVRESFCACPLPIENSIAAGLDSWVCSQGPDGSFFVRTFVQLPPVFACHTTRYQVADDGGFEKVFAPMELQESLELSDGDGVKRYELCSVVLHNGIDLENGHYICVLRAAGMWLLADDTYFRGIGDDELRAFFATGRVNGYEKVTVSIVFYQRVE
jgi:ubiquitin C-terminal hydrolase